MRKYTGTYKWETGVVNEQRSPHSIFVRHDDGALSHHAPRQLRGRQMDTEYADITDFDDTIGPPLYVPPRVENAPAVIQAPAAAVPPAAQAAAPVTAPRRSARAHKPVQRMGL